MSWQILIKDDTATNEIQPASNYSTTTETNGGAFLTQPQPLVPGTNGQSFTFGRNSSYTPRSGGLRERDNNTNEYQNHSPDIDDGVMPDGPDAYFEGESGNNDSQNRGPRQQFEKFAKRTVLLANLPEGTTHQDIVDVVRGGMILDIYLRTHDRAASIVCTLYLQTSKVKTQRCSSSTKIPAVVLGRGGSSRLLPSCQAPRFIYQGQEGTPISFVKMMMLLGIYIL